MKNLITLATALIFLTSCASTMSARNKRLLLTTSVAPVGYAIGHAQSPEEINSPYSGMFVGAILALIVSYVAEFIFADKKDAGLVIIGEGEAISIKNKNEKWNIFETSQWRNVDPNTKEHINMIGKKRDSKKKKDKKNKKESYD